MATFENAPIRIWVSWDNKSADFRLNVTTCDKSGNPLGQVSVGSLDVNDPNLGRQLRTMFQAVRMGMRLPKDDD